MGKDVGTTEAEHQKHLRGPDADAFDLNQFAGDILVAQQMHFMQADFILHNHFGQVSHVGRFLIGQTD